MESQNIENTSANDKTSADSTPALNLLCPICNEFYRASDQVCGISTCGHVFHKHCLSRWLKRSLTCPQCRACCHKQLVFRIHLNFTPATENKEDEKPSETKFYKMDEHFKWMPLNLEDSYLPPEGALQSGVNQNGNAAYVARAYFNNDRLPAHYVPKEKVAYGAWNGNVYTFTDGVELLVLKDCDYEWVDGQNGSYPEDALPTGYSHWGEITYTGRAELKGVMRLGKVHPSYKVIFIPHRGREIGIRSYEVLVLTPRKQSDQ
ncbi:uncharacterized protein LOC119549883 [Drosophila subpulchrella]|uniref:uncharacterized protein LOC119549883 n=1 Tax=Drosophila subpulchrella TaxID=1486046 RepID=UPI0018A155EC|nr:uncharacterized protein LOC119549883 [Drosophila subpulchrella]